MKLLEINVVCGIKSTGRIATEIAKEYERKGYEARIAYGRDSVPKEYQKYAVKIGSKLDVYGHAIISRVFDNSGFCSKHATKKFLEWADEYNPDALWLHNLHGYYINLPMLFGWIKNRPNMEVKWTLHDCWAFTGHCVHFTMADCNRWQTECHNCPNRKEYPCSYIADRSKKNYYEKKELFCDVPNMTIYTPSEWLKTKVQKSFLNCYSVEVLPNKVDLGLFHYTENNIRERYSISKDKKMIISVASSWDKRKGLDDLLELATKLDYEKYVLVLIGLSKKQLKKIPSNVIGIGMIEADELVKFYSASDLLLSASKEETFGLTILEAAACGTRSIVYVDTACEEVALANGGRAVSQNVDSLYKAVLEEE